VTSVAGDRWRTKNDLVIAHGLALVLDYWTMTTHAKDRLEGRRAVQALSSASCLRRAGVRPRKLRCSDGRAVGSASTRGRPCLDIMEGQGSRPFQLKFRLEERWVRRLASNDECTRPTKRRQFKVEGAAIPNLFCERRDMHRFVWGSSLTLPKGVRQVPSGTVARTFGRAGQYTVKLTPKRQEQHANR